MFYKSYKKQIQIEEDEQTKDATQYLKANKTI